MREVILSEHDRELFQKGGVVLAPGAKEKAFIQKFYLYLLMTKPSEQLYVTYSKVSADGKTLRPAYLIQDLRRMYKNDGNSRCRLSARQKMN